MANTRIRVNQPIENNGRIRGGPNNLGTGAWAVDEDVITVAKTSWESIIGIAHDLASYILFWHLAMTIFPYEIMIKST